jgi:hypothetical protein
MGPPGAAAMKEEQRLFLAQARSAYSVYRLLKAQTNLPHCHALHYLQMATELLGKASAWKSGPVKTSHKALVSFLRRLSTNTKAQIRLGYEGENENWTNTIRKITPIADNLQRLAPDLAGDGPNPEYPWPKDAPTHTPAEYAFQIWSDLTDTSYGRTLISFLDQLFTVADEYM